MLRQFTFKNFRSYKSETTFDLQAASLPEFPESVLYGGESRRRGTGTLPVSVIYGPNGGGKSNVLSALACLISAVVDPVLQLRKNRTDVFQYTVPCEPFLLDDSSCRKPTEFQIYFLRGNAEYRYRLSLFREEVLEESLQWRSVGGKATGVLFRRENGKVTPGASLRRKTSTNVNPKMPYLSFLAINYDLPKINDVQDWFQSCILRNYADYPCLDTSLLLDPGIRRQCIASLNDIGINLSGCRYDHAGRQFYTQRSLGGKTRELRLSEESDGTQKLIRVLPAVHLAISRGALLSVDEMDAMLHPKLLRYIVSLFTDPRVNTRGAQLLFTSQDVSTMKNTVFRRDEIWFSSVNERNESELYSLYDIRREDHQHVNNTAAYDKQYLEGRYGADPYLKNVQTEEGWK